MPLFGPNIDKMKSRGNVTALIKVLGRAKDQQVIDSAVDALAQIGKPAVKPLISALSSNKKYLPERAVNALRKIGPEAAEAVPELIKMLDNETGWIRGFAINALGQIGDPRAVEPLMDAMAEKGVTAAKALREIGDKYAVAPLIKALASEDELLQSYASEALGEIGDGRATQPLVTLLARNPLPNTAKALAQLDWQPNPGKAGAWYYIFLRQWDQCALLGSAAQEPLIRFVCKGHYPYTFEDRMSALEALRGIIDKESLELLQTYAALPSDRRLWKAVNGLITQLTGSTQKKPAKPQRKGTVTYTLTKTSLGNPLNLTVRTQKYCVYCSHLRDPNLRDSQRPRGVGECSNYGSGKAVVDFDDTCEHWEPNSRVRFWLSKGYLEHNREGWPRKPWYQVFDDGPDGEQGTR